jgi:hypothetical protein
MAGPKTRGCEPGIERTILDTRPDTLETRGTKGEAFEALMLSAADQHLNARTGSDFSYVHPMLALWASRHDHPESG